MNYFKWLSIILGGGLVFGGAFVGLYPVFWKNTAPRIYPEKQPGWVLPVGLAALMLIAWTAFKCIQAANAYAFIVTFVAGLTLIKIMGIAFFYKKYREIALALIGETLALRTVMFCAAAIGAALLFLGSFV